MTLGLPLAAALALGGLIVRERHLRLRWHRERAEALKRPGLLVLTCHHYHYHGRVSP